VRVRVEVSARACPRKRALANLEPNAFIGLDLGKNMWPFGKEPKIDCLASTSLPRAPAHARHRGAHRVLARRHARSCPPAGADEI
jgi:hypothetical protein